MRDQYIYNGESSITTTPYRKENQEFDDDWKNVKTNEDLEKDWECGGF